MNGNRNVANPLNCLTLRTGLQAGLDCTGAPPDMFRCGASQCAFNPNKGVWGCNTVVDNQLKRGSGRDGKDQMRAHIADVNGLQPDEINFGW